MNLRKVSSVSRSACMPNEVMLAFSFSESNAPFPEGRSKIAQGGVGPPLRIPVPRGIGIPVPFWEGRGDGRPTSVHKLPRKKSLRTV